MRVGVYRAYAVNDSDRMTYQAASGDGIEFDWIADPNTTEPQVLAAGYDAVDVADPCYQWAWEICEQHPCPILTVWENLPWNMLPSQWRRCFDLAKLVVFRSPLAMYSGIEMGCPPEKAIVIPAGVDTEKFVPYTKPGGIVLYAGRMVWQKGIFDLIMASAGQPWKLIMAGGGEQLEEAQTWAAALGMSNIEFLGPIPHAEMPAIYGVADVFCYPSCPTPGWQEQYGIGVLEAAAAGCKIILSEQNVFRWLGELFRVDAYVPPGDWMRLRYWIGELLARPPYTVRDEWNKRQRNLGLMPLPTGMEKVSSEAVGKMLREAYGKLVAVGV